MTGEEIFWIVVYLAGVNTITVAAYAIDKSQAQQNSWRISEASLLFLGLIGGSPGAFTAQRIFRHKTRKAAFQATFWLFVVIQLLLIGILFAMIEGAPRL